jgi:hypothetical protein
MIDGALIKPLSYGKIRVTDLVHAPAIATAVGFAALLLTVVTLLPTERGRGSVASPREQK